MKVSDNTAISMPMRNLLSIFSNFLSIFNASSISLAKECKFQYAFVKLGLISIAFLYEFFAFSFSPNSLNRSPKLL